MEVDFLFYIKVDVLCCSCMRTYILGSRMHSDDLRKLMCPRGMSMASEVVVLKAYIWNNFAGVEIEKSNAGRYFSLRELDGYGGNNYSVLQKRDVSRVIGPLHELRMHDLKLGAAKKTKVPPGMGGL